MWCCWICHGRRRSCNHRPLACGVGAVRQHSFERSRVCRLPTSVSNSSRAGPCGLRLARTRTVVSSTILTIEIGTLLGCFARPRGRRC